MFGCFRSVTNMQSIVVRSSSAFVNVRVPPYCDKQAVDRRQCSLMFVNVRLFPYEAPSDHRYSESRCSSVECRSRIGSVTSPSGRNLLRSNFEARYLGNGKRWTNGLNGERIGNRHRPFERSPPISSVTSYKGRMGIRSFYEIGQSLVMGRSSGRRISETVRDGRFVSTENL